MRFYNAPVQTLVLSCGSVALPVYTLKVNVGVAVVRRYRPELQYPW